MACRKCGAATDRRLCRTCELDERYGDPIVVDDDQDGSADGEDWAVHQEGLGDADARGQATLAGGIRPDGGSEDA